ncbi:Putative hypothetical protein [Helicobacter mustelae 12198]|uniref:Uncharacterized protein n=1 Tax=Helicobacter mustelae (strain ATCC 43772 / CCUG 25715 / CIP 103759 / LMG 18044 / NCTC 12198 / R85-136P) TaxID=679897 RepID=D3UIK8_HELM1|nr:Putative hypothetical protein [Helicobacter mustelae 12198]
MSYRAFDLAGKILRNSRGWLGGASRRFALAGKLGILHGGIEINLGAVCLGRARISGGLGLLCVVLLYFVWLLAWRVWTCLVRAGRCFA